MNLSLVILYLVFVVLYTKKRPNIESFLSAFINLDCLNVIASKFVEAKLVFTNTQPTISVIIEGSFVLVE